MIEFQHIKNIALPQGVVKSLTINNVMVWQQPQEDTHTEIEYIQFNADKVFDTGIICNQNTTIELAFTRDTSNEMYLYGTRNSGNTATITAYLAGSGAWRFGNTYRNYVIGTDAEKVRTVKVNKSGITLDGTLSNYGSTVKTFTAISTLTVGSARTTSGALANGQFIGKLYYYRLYDNGVLVLDWQPCRKADGTECFYDKVSGEYFYNVI